MTEIASIVSSLNALTAAMQEATHKFIATVEANPAAFTQVQATAVDLKVLADHTVRHTDLVREVAGRINIRELAEEYTYGDIAGEISLSDLAGEICLSDLANEISARDIADEIDLNDLRDKCVDAMSIDIDTEEIARKAAEEIDAAAVAQELDTATIAEEIVDSLNLDEMADSIASSLDAEQLEAVGSSLCDRMKDCPDTMRAVLTALSADQDFVAALARAMAEAMVRGTEPQEPHGARDTFVPASEGPDGEQCNAMQD